MQPVADAFNGICHGVEFMAYIDPGSGLLIWQMIVAAVLGILFQIRRFREYLGRLFRKLLRRD